MSALPPKTDMCAATRDVCYRPKADIRQKSSFDTPEGYFQKFVSPAVDHFSFGTRYVSWQPSHAKATALNWLRNASPSDALVVDNFSASTCNFLAFSLKSSHCCQTTGFAAVGACVLPGGNCDAIFPDASLIARASAAIRSSSLLARSRLLIASKRSPMSVINSIRSRTTPVACSWPL